MGGCCSVESDDDQEVWGRQPTIVRASTVTRTPTQSGRATLSQNGHACNRPSIAKTGTTRTKSHTVTCTACAKQHHVNFVCKYTHRQCFNCRDVGHIGKICPQRAKGRQQRKQQPATTYRQPFHARNQNKSRVGTSKNVKKPKGLIRVTVINKY